MLSSTERPFLNRNPFPSCGPEPLGLYPVVDSSLWVKKMLECGVTTIQLRIKNKPRSFLKEEISESIQHARRHQARLFINDYWELAIDLGAYGVHLGQEDIEIADCDALQKAGIRLGVSTHSQDEVERVLIFKPSYIACGPIFHTDTKVMAAAPQGIERLQTYCGELDYPVVAIGGIKWKQLPDVCRAGADGVAVITAMTQSENPEQEAGRWLHYIHDFNVRKTRGVEA